MNLKKIFEKFTRKYLFNPKWRCNLCGKEIFDDGYFCKDCENDLPFIKGNVCDHCGRTLINAQNYCSTCKENLTAIDKARSVFDYKDGIIGLIHKLKFGNGGYLARIFAEQLYGVYIKNRFDGDLLTFVPMTQKAVRKRGYNQAQLIADELGKLLELPVVECVSKVKDSKKQEGLKRSERLKNLTEAFKVTNRKAVKGKNVVIVDDVSTTGSTGQAIAERLKKAGAIKVYLLSVASVPPFDGY